MLKRFSWKEKEYREAVSALIDSRIQEPGWLYNSGVEITPPYKTHLLAGKKGERRFISISDLKNINGTFRRQKAYDLFSEIFLNKTNNDPQSYFSEVEIVIREENLPYHQTSHLGLIPKDSVNSRTRRIEEHEERAFFNYYLESEGKIPENSIGIVSYAMPLPKAGPNLYHLSEVDAIGLSSDKKTAYLLELKNMNSDETLLRSSLEIYTYYSRLALNRADDRQKTINRLKLDFGEVFSSVKDIKPGILLINGGKQYRTYRNMVYDKQNPNLLSLMNRLGLVFFSVNKYDKEGQQIPFINDKDVVTYIPVDEEYVKPVMHFKEGEYIRVEKMK